MIVTIDGPAGAGKSTVAGALADRLGFRFLDTGAMYRAVAWAASEQGVDLENDSAMAELARDISIELRDGRILVDGRDVTEEIRTQAVTAITRYSAKNPAVRRRLIELQRAIAADKNVVTEGRDQGTEAFPGAECKIFLTASAAERARRRREQLASAGESVELETLLAEQERRDAEDSSRPVGALRRASDAIEVCTDGLTEQEVVDRLEKIVRRCQENA